MRFPASSSRRANAGYGLPIVNCDRPFGASAMLTAALQRFPRLELVPTATPLERLERLSAHMSRDI